MATTPFEFHSDHAAGTGPGTRVLVGGHDVTREIVALTVRSSAGELHRVEMESIASRGLDITLPAECMVVFRVVEPGIVDVTDAADGGKRYVFTREAKK